MQMYVLVSYFAVAYKFKRLAYMITMLAHMAAGMQ